MKVLFGMILALTLAACSSERGGPAYPVHSAHPRGYETGYELMVYVPELQKALIAEEVAVQAEDMCGGNFEVVQYFKTQSHRTLPGNWPTRVVVGCI